MQQMEYRLVIAATIRYNIGLIHGANASDIKPPFVRATTYTHYSIPIAPNTQVFVPTCGGEGIIVIIIIYNNIINSRAKYISSAGRNSNLSIYGPKYHCIFSIFKVLIENICDYKWKTTNSIMNKCTFFPIRYSFRVSSFILYPIIASYIIGLSLDNILLDFLHIISRVFILHIAFNS